MYDLLGNKAVMVAEMCFLGRERVRMVESGGVHFWCRRMNKWGSIACYWLIFSCKKV